jgi:hypothetical protein
MGSCTSETSRVGGPDALSAKKCSLFSAIDSGMETCFTGSIPGKLLDLYGINANTCVSERVTLPN